MARQAPSVPKLAQAQPHRVAEQRAGTDREDLKVQLLLGSLAFGSLTLSFYSYLHPFG
jgi:hypothetical protein